MPRKLYEISDFTAGLNAYADARDIKDNQFNQAWNVIDDKDGVLRIIGSAVIAINSENIINEDDYQQPGYGLFQFSSDYSINTDIDGTFDYGHEQGTVVSATNAYTFVLEDTSTVSGTDDTYNGMIIYIYEGTNAGESRVIDDYTGSSRTVAINSGEAFSASPTNTSKYRIFRWKPNNWEVTDNEKDMMAHIDGNYSSHLITKVSSVTTAQSKNLGSIAYHPIWSGNGLTLTPGVEYSLSFDMSSLHKWYNLVSDGDEDGSDATTYGDKVPWVQLYSETVADSSGSVRSIDAATIAGSWQASQEHLNVHQTSTSGNGRGIVVNIKTDSSNDPTFYLVSGGIGYAVDDTIRFTDPGGTGNTSDITVEAINKVGLSLYNNKWMTINDNDTFEGGSPKYLDDVEINYIDDGDFGDTGVWAAAGSGLTLGAASGSTTDDAGYAGLASAKLTTGDSSVWEWSSINEPPGYIHQTLTLPGGTPYHLNFLSKSNNPDENLAFAVYNTTTTEYIVPWTTVENFYIEEPTNHYGLHPDGRWSFVGKNDKKQNYIKFETPKNNDGYLNINQTYDISIRFAPTQNSFSTSLYLHGVTVYKAHNDLVTMSNNNTESANPYNDNIKTKSTYNLKFKIPNEFSTVSDWRLKFYGGQYGWNSSNVFEDDDSLEAIDNQTVHLDNIKLSFPVGDFAFSDEKGLNTLLSVNTKEGSNIALHNGAIWNKNFIEWSGLKAKPVFNYVNGMLKVVDGNFKNLNNASKLLYYHDSLLDKNAHVGSWKMRNDSLVIPPTLSVVATGESATNFNYVFNANQYLNRLYEDVTFGATNWPMDNFVDTTYTKANGNGHIIRHCVDSDITSTQAENESWRHLKDERSTASTKPLATTSGFIKGSSTDWSELGGSPGFYDGTGGSAYWNFNQDGKAMNSLNCLIHANGLVGTNAEGMGMLESVLQESNPSGSVQKIEYRIKYEAVVDKLRDADDNHSDNNFKHSYVPYIRVSAGVPQESSSIGSDGIQAFVNKRQGELQFENGTKKVNNHCQQAFDDEVKIKNSINNPDLIESDNGGGDGDVVNSCIDFTDSDSNQPQHIGQVHVSYLYEGSLSFAEGEIPMDVHGSSKDILFTIEDHPDNPRQFQDVRSNDDAGLIAWLVTGIFSGQEANNPDYAFDSNSTPPTIEKFNLQFGNDEIKDLRYPTYSRFVVEKINVHFYPKFDSDTPISELNTDTDATINVTWKTPLDFTPSGWGGRTYQFTSTTVNLFDEESGFGNQSIDSSTSLQIPDEIQAPAIDVIFKNSRLNDDFVKKTKFYMKDNEADVWYLQFWIDHKENKIHSSTSDISFSGVQGNNNTTIYSLSEYALKVFNEVNSYESETFVSQEDGYNFGNLICRYKASVVANNRLYVGNIYQNGKVYGDRMIKSPIGKYNILPKSNFVDVAINDGDEITALEYYQDKLLQFKRNKVFVINTSGDFEFLEDTFLNIGVQGQFSVTKTPYGIAWANGTGCYLYDGKKVTNLIEGKLPISQKMSNSSTSLSINNRWGAPSTTNEQNSGDCVIGYSAKRDILLIAFTKEKTSGSLVPTGAVYSMGRKSWSLLYAIWSNEYLSSNTGIQSNMITDNNGDILLYNYEASQANAGLHSIRKWVHESSNDLTAKTMYFTTKDITFGNINVKKKIYSVYITYKVKTDGSDSGVSVAYAINGSGDFTSNTFSTSSKFLGTTTDCYAGSTLDETDGKWKTAELIFSNSSNVNNITSFQLQIYGASVAYDFELNDISVSARVKNIK